MADFRTPLYERYVSTLQGRQTSVEPVEAWFTHKYLPLLRSVPRDEPILELGCGTGRLLEFLRRRGFSHARGLDISPEQVALARERGVDAELGDAFDYLERHPSSARALVAADFLEHFTRDELARLLPLVYGAVQPGGVLLVQTANGQGLFAGQVIYGDLTHLTIFTPGSLTQALRASGFERITCYETGPAPIRLRGRLNVLLWGVVKGAANLVRGIEAGKSQRIWTENFICRAEKLL